MNFEHNTWKIFYILFIGALALLLSILFFTYSEITKRHHYQIQHYTEIMSKTIHSDLLHKEMLLDILGRELTQNNTYKNARVTKDKLDKILAQNTYLVGFGLADTGGNLLLTSSNIKNTKNINLLKNEMTREDFLKTFDTENMVMGRTIFFKPLNEWIIPIRKSIRDENGVIIAVMTAGLRNKTNTNYLDSLKLTKDQVVDIVKDYDSKNNMYRQYTSREDESSGDEKYNVPLLKANINKMKKSILEKYNYSLDTLRSNGETISFDFINKDSDGMIVGVKHNKKYGFWVSIQYFSSSLLHEFLRIAYVYFAIYLLSFIVIYWLFKRITDSDKIKKKELVFLAEHDLLTQLPNRTYMYKNIDKWTSVNREEYYVLYIDLDNFKNINDKFGHTVGDKILIEVAHRLEGFFQEDEMLVRQGGDEFIILKSAKHEVLDEDYFSNMISLISKVYLIDNKEFRIGMSVGASCFPKDGNHIEELLSFADTAMYEAKKRRNSYCMFSESMRHNNIVRADIEQELRGAMLRDELWMVYQPQVDNNGRIHGVEALVRWKNEKLGFIGPDVFISVAEEIGLMKELGTYVTGTALKEITKIQNDLDIYFGLSINVSVIELMETSFLSNLLRIIEREEFDRSFLTIEVTESLSIDDLDNVLPLLESVRKEGIEISLDDFGTGYSSLSILRDLPVSELKIDKSFIDKILYDEKEKTLVQSIINIGKNFGMKTLAEGVETIEQVEELKKANCDIFQGYYYSKPLIAEDLVSYLKKNIKREE